MHRPVELDIVLQSQQSVATLILRQIHIERRVCQQDVVAEVSHGEAFALLMKTDPRLTSGVNVLWIKFFLTAVYATMYVRDHQRPAFHKALGVDPDWYAHEVFTKTSALSQQIFPITLDIEHPRWQRNLVRLHHANVQIAEAKERGGLGGKLSQMAGSAKAALAFVSLYTIPARKHTVPASTRLEPVY